ncbi:MAG: response regulator [Bacteroidia bacterium]|nr:response regulator [Bacteroidia bacterium]
MSYKKIILVDDNPTTIFYNQDVVSDFCPGAEIMAFENPIEFIAAYGESLHKEEEAMLLLLDINMPLKLGYEVLEELEETHDNLDNLHVLMVTSSNLRNDVEKSSRFLCVVGYIEKPLTVAKINKVLNGF